MAALARKDLKESRSGTTEEDIRDHYPEFTRLLLERRDEITGRVNEERANLDQQVLAGPGDDADISVVDTSADYFLNLANTHQKELIEIRDAIDRMRRGVYGLCESCEFPIALNRLKHLPYARLCIECQSAIEGTRLTRRLQSIPKL